MQLDLAKFILFKNQQMKFLSIDEASSTEVQHENPDKLVNQKSQNKQKHAEEDEVVVPGQQGQSCEVSNKKSKDKIAAEKQTPSDTSRPKKEKNNSPEQESFNIFNFRSLT